MATAPSNASLFYLEIVGQKKNAHEFLRALAGPSTHTEENEWRDFKTAQWVTATANPEFNPSKKVQQIWSEYLSAFANSAGGVLIWGIIADNRIATGIDLAAEADELAERLLELVGNATDPPVLGVQVSAIRRGSSREGFVVCYVPASEHVPHRSVWAEHEYYIRVQDGNFTVPTAVLRRMFYPQFFPLVVPRATASIAGDYLHLKVGLTNQGTASAEMVLARFSTGGFVCGVDPEEGWRRVATMDSDQCYASDFPIHPGLPVRLFNDCAGKLGSRDVYNFVFEIFSRNASPITCEISFTIQDIETMIVKKESITRSGLLKDQPK